MDKYLQAINTRLRGMQFVHPEIKGVQLKEGKEYYYFTGGNSAQWARPGNYFIVLEDLTIEQWVEQAILLSKNLKQQLI